MWFLIYTLAIIGGGLVVSASMITIYYLIEKIVETFKERKEK